MRDRFMDLGAIKLGEARPKVRTILQASLDFARDTLVDITRGKVKRVHEYQYEYRY